MKIRIGYYDDSKVRSGTARYLFDLLSGLNREEFEPIFFASANYSWHEELRRLDVKVVNRTDRQGGLRSAPSHQEYARPSKTSRRFRLPRSLAWHLGLAFELKDIYCLFKSEPVDLFHSNNCGAEPAPIAARLTGKPVVGTLHVDPTYDLFGERGSRRYRNLEKVCLRSLDRMIAVSHSTLDLWSIRCNLPDVCRSTRMRVIYNGIDASRFTRQRESLAAKRSLDLPDDAFVIVSLGRLEPAKGYESLIRALPAVIHAIPSAHVCIGGQGFLKEDLLKLAGSLGVKERVHFVGFKADVRDILEVGDIYVQPSLCDAFPYSVLEALACGLPSIVTNVGGMPEMVKSGENGVVIPPQNPAALAQAVTSLANDNCSRLLFGTRGRAWVQKHCSMTAMYGSTFALYRQLARMDLAGTSLKDHTVVPC